jgi:hypothetical protein
METWPRGQGIVRCHDSRFGATEFNPGLGHGRFHPFQDSRGDLVPTLYGASSLDGALSESIFHNVPVRGPGRAIRHSALRPMQVSTVAARRDLTLIQLHGHGLGRLGVSRAELIDAEVRQYVRTAAWAAALHIRQKGADGLIWVSRKFDTSFALVIFGDRVARGDLEVIEPPLPLFVGAGYDEIQRWAGLAGITVLE